jgi:hypothetical protein
VINTQRIGRDSISPAKIGPKLPSRAFSAAMNLG